MSEKNKAYVYAGDRRTLGVIGEYYVMYELAKRGIWSTRLLADFDYDLITHNGLRIEVKTARSSHRKSAFVKKDGTKSASLGWLFANHFRIVKSQKGYLTYKYDYRKRVCDFYIFVCYDRQGTVVERVYIVPNDEKFSTGKTLRIPYNDSDRFNGESQWTAYKERWDLINALQVIFRDIPTS